MRDCIAWHEISIHAPAQGATYLFAATNAGFNFNPRPRARGDVYGLPLFQVHRNFNPRPRARGDFSPVIYDYFKEISIHAPAQGATVKV